jgi:hypothetical protein
MAGTVFPQTLGQQWVDPYAAQIDAMRARMAQPAQPMYSPDEQQARLAQNTQLQQLGLLGQLSGDEALGNVGGTIFKQALAQRQPRVTERGVADPLTGKFAFHPDYLRERDEASLAGLEAKSAAARGAYEAERRQAADKRELQNQRMDDLKELRRIGAANGQVGAFQPAGFTPEGKNVVTNTKSGVNYVLQMNPDGTPNYIPYGGVYTPKNTFDKAVVEAQEQLGSGQRADALIKSIERNPDAFGVTAAAIGLLPGKAQGWVSGMAGLSREQMNLRAQVTRDAAMELNRIFGAAQSAGELARAAAWAPNASDDFDTTITKLQAARDWAFDNAKRAGPGVVDAARQRAGAGGAGGSWEAPAAAPGGEGWSITPKGATAPPARRGM